MSLHVEAANRLETMKETKYIHVSYEGHYCYVNHERGVYKYDECGMIYNLLEEVNPAAYKELKKALKVADDWEKPTAAQYHYFFHFRPFERTETSNWRRVKHIKDLKPGDILAWQAKVCLIMETPVDGDEGYGKGIYKVKVVDSKQVPNHDQDSRLEDERCFVDERGVRTGMGSGYIALKEEMNGYFSMEPNPEAGKKMQFEATGAVVGRCY